MHATALVIDHDDVFVTKSSDVRRSDAIFKQPIYKALLRTDLSSRRNQTLLMRAVYKATWLTVNTGILKQSQQLLRDTVHVSHAFRTPVRYNLHMYLPQIIRYS